MSIDLVQDHLDHCFGIAPRDQHRGIDVERQRPELLLTDQIGDRLSGQAPFDEPTIGGQFLRCERSVVVDIELHSIARQRVSEKDLSVEPRRLDARPTEPIGRPLQHTEYGPSLGHPL